jgi:glutamyl-tRNA synthetase
VAAAITAFKASYDPADEMNAWFDKVKAIASDLGYAADMKAYKADPAAFKGSVADISGFLRLAVTGKLNAPDLYTVMQLLGKDRVFARLDSFGV